VIGNHLWSNLLVWCSCHTCINYSVRQGCVTWGPRAKCNTAKWIFVPVTSTRQSVQNEGVAWSLICLIAFSPSVIKVAHPWYTTICETGGLICLWFASRQSQGTWWSLYSLNILIASINVINLFFSPKVDRWKQFVELTASQHSLCFTSNKNEFIGIWHHPSSSWHIASEIKSEEAC